MLRSQQLIPQSLPPIVPQRLEGFEIEGERHEEDEYAMDSGTELNGISSRLSLDMDYADADSDLDCEDNRLCIEDEKCSLSHEHISPEKGTAHDLTNSFDATNPPAIPYQTGYDSVKLKHDNRNLMSTPTSKACAKKSFVWKYFHHPELSAGILDRSRTQCSLCASQLAFNASGTTTTMLNHLKSRHGDIAEHEELQRRRPKSGLANRVKEVSQKDPTSDNQSVNQERSLGYIRRPQNGTNLNNLSNSDTMTENLQASGLDLRNVHLPPAYNPLLPLGCFPGLTEKQQRAFFDQMISSQDILYAGSKENGNPFTSLAQANGPNLLPTTNAALLGSIHSNLNLSVPNIPATSFLNDQLFGVASAIYNGTFKLNNPTNQQHSPGSTSSGIGLSVTSPTEAPTTSADSPNHQLTSSEHTVNNLSPGNRILSRPTNTSHQSCHVQSPQSDHLRPNKSSLPQKIAMVNLTTTNDALIKSMPIMNGVPAPFTNGPPFDTSVFKPTSYQPVVDARRMICNPSSPLPSDLQVTPPLPPPDLTSNLGGTINFVPNLTNMTNPMNGGGAFAGGMVASPEQIQWLASNAMWLSELANRGNWLNPSAENLVDPHKMLNLFLSAPLPGSKPDSIDFTIPKTTMDSDEIGGQSRQLSDTSFPSSNEPKHVYRDASSRFPTSPPNLSTDLLSGMNRLAGFPHVPPTSKNLQQILNNIDATDSLSVQSSTETLDLSKPKILSESNRITGVQIGANCAKRKRARPSYMPSESQAVSVVESSEDERKLTKPFSRIPMRTELLHHLAYYLVKDLQPPEVVELQGFKALMEFLSPHGSPTAHELRSTVMTQLSNDLQSTVDSNLRIVVKEYFQTKSVQSAMMMPSALSLEMWSVEDGSNASQTAPNYYGNFGIQYYCKKTKKLQTQVYASDKVTDPLNLMRVLRRGLGYSKRPDEAVSNHNDGDVTWSHPIVTNQAQYLQSQLSLNEPLPNSDILVMPCFVSELSAAVMDGLKSNQVRELFQRIRPHPCSNQSNTGTTNGTSMAIDDFLSSPQVYSSWADADAILNRVTSHPEHFNLSMRDIEMANDLNAVLQTMNQTLELIHRDNLILTASMIAPILQNLQRNHLAMSQESEISSVENACFEFRTVVSNHLTDCYPDDSKLKEILEFATVLDPRFKDQIKEQKPGVVKMLNDKVSNLSATSGQVMAKMKSDSSSPTKHSKSSDNSGLNNLFGLPAEPRTSPSEADRYLREDPLSLHENPFEWWLEKSSIYPNVAEMAYRYLTIPLTCYTPGRLIPYPSTTVDHCENDGIGLPHITDRLGQGRKNLKEIDQPMYNFLWHQWVVEKPS